jgi:transcriptional regulator with XRE-family HTH domain
MIKKERPSHRLLRQTSKSFGESVLRAMLVSAENIEGNPKKMTQQQLAEKSGVGRSTIAKYSTSRDDENVVVNPDLETICRLADALNVSPAFLLMRPDDWSRLAQAAMFFSSAINDPKFAAFANDISSSSVSNTVATSMIGLQLAERFDLFVNDPIPDTLEKQYADQIRKRTAKIRGGILSTSALPPISKLKKSQLATLLSLCAVMGANVNSFE